MFNIKVVLLSLLGFHLASNLLWILLNNTPPAWDEANHARISFLFLHAFQNILSGSAGPEALLPPFTDSYGPLLRILDSLLLVIQPSEKWAQVLSTPFFLLSIWVTYLLGTEIFKSRKAGLLGALLFSFFQAVYDHSRWLLLDVPLIFFVLTTLLFLIKSNFLEKKKYSVLAFIFLALTCLAKFQGLIYLVLPFTWAGVLALRNRKRLYHFILGTSYALPFVLIWLIPSWKNIGKHLAAGVRAEPISDPTQLLDISTWFHYLKLFINYEIGFFVFLVFLPSLLFYAKSTHPYKKWLITYIMGYYALFTIFPNKDMRYLFPVLPFVALVFAKGLLDLKKQNLLFGKLAIFSVLAFNLVFYFSLSFGFPFSKGARAGFELPIIKDIVTLNLSDYPVRQFDASIWPTEQIIQDINSQDPYSTKKVLVAIDHARINNSNLVMYLTKNKIAKIELSSPFNITELNPEELDKYIKAYNLALIPQEDTNPFYLFNKRALDQIRAYFLNSNLTPQKTYQLPTGEKLHLYSL